MAKKQEKKKDTATPSPPKNPSRPAQKRKPKAKRSSVPRASIAGAPLFNIADQAIPASLAVPVDRPANVSDHGNYWWDRLSGCIRPNSVRIYYEPAPVPPPE